ncbi:MAG TPA: LysR family transcriptional regulator [Steroidobacteraceae bacterium]|jgi:DNA-binding transcriptional LysR family regulator|nr:LysR family transcriptional regulator [Steroidobacteraceae bacterium]
MDRYEQLNAFVEVTRWQSFAQAAQHLERHVSAVSRAVAALENRLGVRLLQRTTRRVTLSDAGRGYFKRCETLLAELEGAEAEVREQAASLRGTLRVSAATGAGQSLIGPIVPEFLAVHPLVTLDLQLSNRYVDLVEEGFDVALRVGTLAADSRLVVRRLAPTRRVLVASRAYLERRGSPRSPQQLCEHSCLVLDIGNSPRRWQLQRGRTELAVDVSGPLHSNNSFLLLTACRAGAGIGLLPATVATADLRNGQLSQVLSGWSSTEQGIYAVYPSARFIPAKVRAFVEFMAARLRGSGEN